MRPPMRFVRAPSTLPSRAHSQAHSVQAKSARALSKRAALACFGIAFLPFAALATFQAVTGHWQSAPLLVVLAASLITATLVRLVTRKLRPGASAISGGDHQDEPATAQNRDALTGLQNRHGFLDSSERVLGKGSNSVIALVDIDHFQSINDRFGTAAGDALLRAVGHRLERGLRRSDLAARWSGKEFAVLLPDTQLDEARLVMERLRASVALDPLLGPESTGNAWPVTFSCGLAPVRDFAHFGEATHRAHAALDAAKNGGRNRVRTAGNG